MLLDCETEETTYASLETILDLKREEIESKLDKFALPSIFIPEGTCPWEFLVSFLEAKHLSKNRHSGTCWFHGTRTHEPDSFRRGISPLTPRLDDTWTFLYGLVADQISETAWGKFRHDTERCGYGHAEAWRSKLKEQGPCGYFLREMLLNPAGHDYLRIPELVDHIAECFRYDWPHINLREIYWRATMPYVIKFKSRNPRSWEIGCALFYLYVKRQELRMKSFVWAHFVGDGTPIPGDDVLKITSLVEIAEQDNAKLQKDLAAFGL